MELEKKNILLEDRQTACIREEDRWMKGMLIQMGFDPLYGEEPDGIPYPESEDPLEWWDWSRRTLARRWLMKESLTDAGDIYKTSHEVHMPGARQHLGQEIWKISC